MSAKIIKLFLQCRKFIISSFGLSLIPLQMPPVMCYTGNSKDPSFLTPDVIYTILYL